MWQENEQEMEVLLRSLTRLANHLGLVVILLKLTNIRSSNFSAPSQIKISTRPERKKERAKERNKDIDDDEIDDDDKARELNYDLEINIYFDNAFEKRSTAPKWNQNDKTWEAFDPKKHGYTYYANDKDIQGWDSTIIIMEFQDKFSDKKLSQEKEWKVCNKFVKQLSDLLKKVLSGYGLEEYWEHSQAFVTPYGGKIVWNLNGTIMNIHLKDADVIKRGKRWSQIMYLYSLFGWKITDVSFFFL